MNLILFTENELGIDLPTSDPRAKHILEVLRRKPGEPFDVGVINGSRGKATVVSADETFLRLAFDLRETPCPPFPVSLLVGLSRPQAMRRVLRDCTSLGVSRFAFFSSDRGEAGYAESSLWKSGEFRRHLIDGAQQAFSTRLPRVEIFPSLEACIPERAGGIAVALDNYESRLSLGALVRRSRMAQSRSNMKAAASQTTLIVGSERGWSAEERGTLGARGIPLVHLGKRVLRTEVACISAISIVLSELGFYDHREHADRG
jgi:RsmE family RNA methyltransferase